MAGMGRMSLARARGGSRVWGRSFGANDGRWGARVEALRVRWNNLKSRPCWCCYRISAWIGLEYNGTFCVLTSIKYLYGYEINKLEVGSLEALAAD
jgi:hypothetical protein